MFKKKKKKRKRTAAVEMNNCFHCQFEFDVRWKVGCHLHLSQAVEAEEGMSAYPCDAVALGNLAVAQRSGSASVSRLTRAGKQITLETSHTSRK